MKDKRISFDVILRAAFQDIAENLFRPVHNLKVVFGLAKEKSIEDRLREAGAKNDRNQLNPTN